MARTIVDAIKSEAVVKAPRAVNVTINGKTNTVNAASDADADADAIVKILQRLQVAAGRS